jgi:general secretion pathway protein L
MLNLNSTIELDFKKFIRWWKRELDFLIPDRVKELISDKTGIIFVRPYHKEFALSFWHNGKEDALVTLDREGNGVNKFSDLMATDEKLQKAEIVFRLTENYALQKELSLPLAAQENLHQVVSYELPRYSPLITEHAYFDVKPMSGPNEPGQIRVNLILTAKDVVDNFYAELKSLGITPSIVDYDKFANDFTADDEPYNLLPESLRQQTAITEKLIHGGLFALVGLLLLGVIALPVWFESRAVNELEEKINTVEKEAKKIKLLQSEVDALIDETQQLIDKKTERPPVVAILDTLSRVIKDDTWLAYAQYASGQLQIQGESPAASTLISVLEASDIFANVKFVSPVTRDNVTKLERFQISAEITKAGDKDGSAK